MHGHPGLYRWGERDSHTLAGLRDACSRPEQATVAGSLHGKWRIEHLFALRQALGHRDFLTGQIAGCDRAISQALATLAARANQLPPPLKLLRSKSFIGASHREHLARMDIGKAIPNLGLKRTASAVRVCKRERLFQYYARPFLC